MLITILFVSLLAISAVNAVENVTDDVANVEDMPIEVASEEIAIDDDLEIAPDDSLSATYNVSGNTFLDIQNAIDGAKDNDTIELSGNYTGNGTVITINKTLNIVGKGETILDAKNLSGIFKINLNNVTLKNLKFINANIDRAVDGCPALDGRLYYYPRYAFQCINCTFDSNLMGASSSGNYMNCTFKNNKHFYDKDSKNNILGGAIYYGTAVNCIFINNYGYKWAGAMFMGDALNCTFINNSAVYGGAIAAINPVNCTFINNSASENGGAIETGVAINCTFTGNSAGNLGGAADWSEAFNCTFTQNHADIGGGAMYRGNATNCTFTDNSAGVNGGAAYLINAVDCIFSQNYALGSGGAMFNGSAENCSIFNNSYPQTDGEAVLINTSVVEYGVLHVSQSANYYREKILTIKLLSYNGAGIADANVLVKFSNGKSANLVTNYKGVATYSVPFTLGTYSATVSVSNKSKVSPVKVKSIKIVKAPVKIVPTKLTTTYKSGKYFQVKVINSKTKKAKSGVKLTLKVYTGKKYKTVTITTNSKGIAKYSASALSVGSHKIVVSIKNKKFFSGTAKTSSVKVSKAPISISAPKVVNVYKSGTFKVTIKNKNSKKVMSGVKVTIKVYTGKKYKTFNVKTNSKGIASISTKSLSKTTHKVVVNVKGTSNVKKASAKSSIKIIKRKTPTTINNGTLVYKYSYNRFIGVSGVFGVYANGKLLTNKQIELYSYDGTYLKSITSGSESFISAGTVKFKFAGDSYYSPSSYVLRVVEPKEQKMMHYD